MSTVAVIVQHQPQDRHGPNNGSGAGGSRQSHSSRSRRSKSRSTERHERDRERDRHFCDGSQQHRGLINSKNNEKYERKLENGGIDGIGRNSTSKKGYDKHDNIQGRAKGDVLAIDDIGMNIDSNDGIENAVDVDNSIGEKIRGNGDDSPLSSERKRRRMRYRNRNNQNS
jgi:hypothetical protein